MCVCVCVCVGGGGGGGGGGSELLNNIYKGCMDPHQCV